MFGLGRKAGSSRALVPAAREPNEGTVDNLLAAFVVVARTQGLLLGKSQLIQDNLFSEDRITVRDLVVCARKSGFKARRVRIEVDDFWQLWKTLPAIVVLRSGAAMLLVGYDKNPDNPRVHLADPLDYDGQRIYLDPVRFDEAWTGDLIVLKRNFDLADEEKPFSLGLIAALVFREQRIVRDVLISAFFLGMFALAPIMFWRLILEKVLYYEAFNSFAVICVFMLVIIAFEAAYYFYRTFLLNVIIARVDARMNEYIFDRLLRLPIDFFERSQVGRIAHDVQEVYRIRDFMAGQLFGTALDSMMLLFFVPVMLAFSLMMSAIVFGFCGLIVIWLLVMLPPLRRAVQKVIYAQTVRGAFLYQTLAGIRTVKSLALETRHRQVWDHQTAEVARTYQELSHLSGIIQTVVKPLERLAVSVAFAAGVYYALVTRDPTMQTALFAFLLLSQRVAAPLMQLAQLVHQLDEARAAVTLVASLVNLPKEDVGSASGVRKPLEGHVEFVNLRFKYPGSANYALDHLSFEIPVGHTLGVVGRSGSGKTTVTRLLQRLHTEYEGLIKVDGVDVREYDMQFLRRSLGVVLQENFLFSGTIRENITAAKPDATFDETVNACRMAGAEEFVERLPRGYETFIYEGSPNLSGGQKQRLAIARALILDPRILILDEATSALDPESEAIVNDNIRRIAAGRTVIVISHRLSSLVNSDSILVLERGRFEAMGTHSELLQTCDIYRTLWNQQNRHTEAALRHSLKGPARVS